MRTRVPSLLFTTLALALVATLLAACGGGESEAEREHARGLEFALAGEFGPAILAFDAAIAADPDFAPAFAGRGE